jgi:hypothetical protein
LKTIGALGHHLLNQRVFLRYLKKTVEVVPTPMLELYVVNVRANLKTFLL